ncbi:T9SS type A sorting domain-containing protein [Hwangdonia lutea]|uniref:T9SS type A sorting domain-containing protein n=1 Tax=Hwangdonia lutea TaxID=3075823 RepID=A0AA97EMT2_9FLAO|nr:T9SS type A sorting domain-containing protein [Hwangdonia sp. SCSIO 19198]WOD44279.1 T9SS type A sorting domain-containing protein [Hwangdonia sp. SCSIO 19198]
MKTKLLALMFLGMLSAHAQTTHNLNWEIGIGTLDLTIDEGDTVIWTWTDGAPHTVTSLAGSAETFDSGSKTGNGMTFSKTFNVVGSNPYQCNFHPSTMKGTITVEGALSVDDFRLKGFAIHPNPANTVISFKLPKGLNSGTISVFDLLGKQLYSNTITKTTLDISGLNNGLYVVKISSEGIHHTKRFIKQ